MIHEVQHYIMCKSNQYSPKWINEGISEVFETGYMRGKYLYSEKQSDKEQLLKSILKRQKVFQLKKFLSESNDEWKKHDTTYSYTMSWGIVYFFI